MTTDLHKILESKRSFRRELAARPVAEKLRMLDAMRERELAIRAGRSAFADESAQAAASGLESVSTSRRR
jgi:hypothetical protein